MRIPTVIRRAAEVLAFNGGAHDEIRTLRRRKAELQVALDRMQSAALAAQTDADHLRKDLFALERDRDGFVEEIRDLNDQLAAETARADGAERALDGLVKGLGEEAGR